jgi:hypothetical protein
MQIHEKNARMLRSLLEKQGKMTTLEYTQQVLSFSIKIFGMTEYKTRVPLLLPFLNGLDLNKKKSSSFSAKIHYVFATGAR